MAETIESLISLKGKTALVTGAAMGIGRAISGRLHEAGANIVLVDINYDQVQTASSELHAIRPDSSYAVHADVSSYEDVKRSVDEGVTRFGTIDILVNNAGIFPIKTIADMTESDFDKVLAVNLKSVYMFTKLVSEVMKSNNNGGRIVNITSIDALHPSNIGLAHYDASKHGVWGFTKNAALELAQHNIWVNAVAPGGVATPGAAAVMQDPTLTENIEMIKKLQEEFLKRIPMHRMGDPDDIARATLFLSSDLASYITGSQLVVDGGALLK